MSLKYPFSDATHISVGGARVAPTAGFEGLQRLVLGAAVRGDVFIVGLRAVASSEDSAICSGRCWRDISNNGNTRSDDK